MAEYILECDSDDYFNDGMKCNSEKESVKCVDDICDVNGMNVLNKCESVEFVCENENSIN